MKRVNIVTLLHEIVSPPAWGARIETLSYREVVPWPHVAPRVGGAD